MKLISLPPVVQAEFEEEEYQVHEDAGSVEVCVALTTETAKDVVVRIVGSKNNISELVFEGGRERMTAHFPTYM